MIDFTTIYSLLTIFLVSLVVVLAACEIGRRLGVLANAMLGMLAPIVGFTFAMALSRFEARRDAVLNEPTR